MRDIVHPDIELPPPEELRSEIKRLRVSDKGPGVENKNRAMEFGFSGASPLAGVGLFLAYLLALHRRANVEWRF